MEFNSRTTCFDARLLRGLVGTVVATYDFVSDGASPQSTPVANYTEPSRTPNSPTSPYTVVASLMDVLSISSTVPQTWVITKKINERAAPTTDYDVKLGRGSAKTVGKFLCQSTRDPNQTAFMRIYQQIPITGTEDADNDTLARQAVAPEVCGELECFKMLQTGGCSAAPRFLGHAESTQGDNDLLPGGYIRYIVWEKVPGKPLTKELFWGLNITTRNDIRAKFRNAYQQLVACGISPDSARISKIIFDQSTGSLHICGFRMGWPIILDEIGWTEYCYVAFGLAERSKEADWYLPPENWHW